MKNVNKENIVYNQVKSVIASYVCNKGATKNLAINRTIAGLGLGGGITKEDIVKILSEIYEQNVKAFEGSVSYPHFFKERKERFDVIKYELLNKKTEKGENQIGFDKKQTEEMKEKKTDIIQNYKNTKNNLLKSKENITKSDEKLKTTLLKIDNQIENIDKTVELIEITPEKALETHNYILNPLWTSVNAMSFSGLNYSTNLLNKTKTMVNHANIIDGVSGTSEPTFKSSVTTSYSGNRIIVKVYPDIQKDLDHIKIETSHDKRGEVENLLKTIDEDVLKEFNVVWQTYLSITEKPHVKQAAHSMREVISILLQKLARDEDVMNSDWFKPEKDDGKPTQRQRVKYAILGKTDEGKLTDEDLSPIDDNMKDLRNKYEELNPLAHERSKVDLETLKNLLEPIIKNGQDLIITLFELREKYYSE